MSTPGPGSYSPNRVDLERPPSFYLSGPSSRDDWLKNSFKRPGPGAYSPSLNYTSQSQSRPRWSFGDKSRKRKRSNPPIAVDRVFVRLEQGMNREKTLTFLEKRPEIKEFVAELLDEIIRMKPEDPVQYLRDKFQKQKDERDEQEPKVQTNDIFNFADLSK